MDKVYVKSKGGKIIFILVAFLLLLLVGNSFIKDIILQFTKHETVGQIISIEPNKGLEPYRLKVRYFDVNRSSFVEYYKLISNASKEKIGDKKNVTVLFSNFIENIYIKEDEYPMFFDFILQLIAISSLLVVIVGLANQLRNKKG